MVLTHYMLFQENPQGSAKPTPKQQTMMDLAGIPPSEFKEGYTSQAELSERIKTALAQKQAFQTKYKTYPMTGVCMS